VICRQVLHYLDQPSTALAGVRRVLRAEGTLLLSQIVPFGHPVDADWWRSVVAARQPARVNAMTVEQMEDLLSMCGFEVVASYEVLRRSSLVRWLDRYAISASAHAEVVAQFANAPDIVKQLRGFGPVEGDMEYSIRWVTIEARSS
jgi:2-polyprenyl-3-methyl-5-hydroxy-6-metoxy-1,4-benzoquinol methylase